MAHSMWITVISICCMFCNITSITASAVTSNTTFQETTVHTRLTSESWPLSMYISIYVPVILIMLAAIVITLIVVMYRRKRARVCLQHVSIYKGNPESSHIAEYNSYKSTEKENDNYKPKPTLTPKEEPIYINVQGQSSLELSVEGDRAENIYCNVVYHKQQ